MDEYYRRKLDGWLKGDAQAQQFVLTLFSCLHTCDDLTDGDIDVPTEHVHRAFWKMLIELPRNPFYTKHFALLNGALQVAFLNWEIANGLEVSEEPHAKAISFVLRDSYTDLVTLCAWIIGGEDWAKQVGRESRLDAAREGPLSYLDNLTREHRSAIVKGGA
jgi:hypothetical protein